ncbi:hypothetical protein C3L33_11644, partial [Rhododendron williamsianum]
MKITSLMVHNMPVETLSENLVANTDNSRDDKFCSSCFLVDLFISAIRYRLDRYNLTRTVSPGVFSVEADPEGTNQFFILQGSQKYWTTGMWNGLIFSEMPEMRLNYVFDYTYFSNENGSYFTYSMYNPSIISRLMLDTTGQVAQLTWLESVGQWNRFWSQPRGQCDVYAYCGTFATCNQITQPFCQCLRGFEPNSVGDQNAGDMSGGCMRKAPLQCGNDSAVNGRKDQFLHIAKVRLPANSIVLSQVKSVGDCKLACFSNCSCSAYTYSVSGCSIWGNELLNVAWDLWKSGRGEGIKDPTLQDISSTNMLLRYVNIGFLCVQESAADRPTMSDVISMLSNELMLLASPKQPAFSTSRSVPDLNSSKQLEICSINDVTVSILEAR